MKYEASREKVISFKIKYLRLIRINLTYPAASKAEATVRNTGQAFNNR